MSLNITFCTTCKHRGAHLRLTLPKNMEDNPKSQFLVLDYGDSKELSETFKSLLDRYPKRLTIFRFEAEKFHMAHAKNMAARLAIRRGADVVVTLDADNFTNKGFENYIQYAFEKEPRGIFLCPLGIGRHCGSIRIKPRGVAGRLVIRSQDFIKAGGYDEQFDTWHGEDVDIAARLRRIGFRPRPIPGRYLDAITHHAGLRFKEYPHAQELYENDAVVKRICNESHRIVNYGKIGCGTVTKHNGKKVTIGPVPTRVFGIGWQRTGTTSLAKAFDILGFDSFHFNDGEQVRILLEEMQRYGSSPLLERYYALCDSPIPILYKQLDEAYPNSKFILTVRNSESWLKSVEWLFSDENPYRWTWDEWPISDQINQAMYGQTSFDKNRMLQTYLRHNREVIKYFEDRPEDLLVMDTKHASFEHLAPFLGQPIPDKPYPWEGASNLPWWEKLKKWLRGADSNP